MPNDVLTPPIAAANGRHATFHDSESLHFIPQGAEGSVWSSLISNLRDVLHPQKLPPLVLTSTPVAVTNPFEVKRSTRSSVISIGAHVVLFALILLALLFWKHQPQVKQAAVKPIDISAFLPRTLPAPTVAGGGGGGGAHQIAPPTRGKLPQFAKQQVVPPQMLTVDHPKIPVPPTVVMPNVKMPDANMPNLGTPDSTQVTLSAGNGGGSGIGHGHGGGIGAGSSSGVGPGEGGNLGGGLAQVGGGVSAPKVVYSVQPEFSDEARREKHQGTVVVQLIVDQQGNPQNVRVIRPLGMGLDEKAIEAARQYKFRPAMRGGQPVPVMIQLDINFQLF